MMGIAIGSEGNHLRIDMCTSCQCYCSFFQQEHTGTFRHDKGVVKADVSVFRPYWSIIIYDSNQTDWKSIVDSIKKEHVKFAELTDEKIDAVPEIIIPKGLGLKPQRHD